MNRQRALKGPKWIFGNFITFYFRLLILLTSRLCISLFSSFKITLFLVILRSLTITFPSSELLCYCYRPFKSGSIVLLNFTLGCVPNVNESLLFYPEVLATLFCLRSSWISLSIFRDICFNWSESYSRLLFLNCTSYLFLPGIYSFCLICIS